MRQWQPSHWIALVAVLVSPMGGLLVAWYTAYRQERAAQQRELSERWAAAEEGLAQVARVGEAAKAATGRALIGGDDPYWKRVKQILDLVSLADQATDKLTYAKVRHPNKQVRGALGVLTNDMRRLSMFAEFTGWAEKHNPDDHRLANVDQALARHINTVTANLERAEQELYAYHQRPGGLPWRAKRTTDAGDKARRYLF